MLKRILAALLALLSVATFAACASDTADDGTNAETTSSADTTVAETTAELSDSEMFAKVRSELPDVDYDGYTFKVIDRESENWGTEDVFAEAQNGDPINDAVFERNSIIEDEFNIKITEQRLANGKGTAEAAKLVLASEDSFDVLTDGLSYMTKQLAVPGYIVDLNTVEELKLDADHWDQRLGEGLSIGGKLYFSTGDISIMDNKGTWAILFNKNMLEDFSLDDPYTLVNDGTWTIDRVHEMAATASLDLDGDSVMGEGDQWGYLTEEFNTFALWAGSGETVTKKVEGDLPELSVYNERSVSVLEKSLTLMLDANISFNGSKHSQGWGAVTDMFANGKTLIYHGGLRLVSVLRNSDVDFGIVPAPKYDEAQDAYYNTYSFSNFTAYAIPISAGNLSRTGNVMEAMAALSKYSLTPAYYDISLEGKFLRDEESSGMIDIILATRSFDLGAMFDWGGTFSMFTNMYNNKSYDMASAYASVEAKALTAIDDFVETLAD